jgi:hypothetical protein
LFILMPAHLIPSAASGGLWGCLLLSLFPAGNVQGTVTPDSAAAADSALVSQQGIPTPIRMAGAEASSPPTDTLELPAVRVKSKPRWGLLSRADEPVGTYRLAAGDMARSVSNFDDPSRIVQTLPGVGRGNDWETALIVRGGAPDQTGYLVDGIPVSKVSHYEGMRNDHGGVGILNMTFADGVDFHNGAFAAHLPDRMSGMVEVHFRDGNTVEHQGRLITDVTGAGAAVEGPLQLDGRKGSYAAVFRYSTMDLLIRSGILEAYGTPRFYNGQARAYLPMGNSAFRLSIVGGGEKWYNGIGDQAVLDLGGGIVATSASWEKKEDHGGWLRADASFQRRMQDEDFHNLTKSDNPGTDSLSRLEAGIEDRYRVSMDRLIPLNPQWTLRAGALSALVVGRYQLEHGNEELFIPEADTTVNVNSSVHLYPDPFAEAAAYVEATWRSKNDAWETYMGYRHFYEHLSRQSGFGPRLGFKYRPTPRHALKAAFGLHTQPHDYMELSQRPDPRRAKLPYTAQTVAGWESYLPAGLLVSVEAFDKEAFRLARRGPMLMENDYSTTYVDTGRTRSLGGELYIRKPRGGRFSFSMAYNYLWHRERNSEGNWAKSEYSIPHAFNAFAEIRLAKGLFLGSRYTITSGLPYIPYDSAASMQAGTGVYDLSRAYTVSGPYFARLDMRLEWNWVQPKFQLAVFAEVENLTDRSNYFAHSWNTVDGGEMTLQGMQRVPVAGISIKF